MCGWKVDITSDTNSNENENIEPKTELAKAGVDSNTEELLKVIKVTKADQIKTMSNEELLKIAGMTEKRLKVLREIIPSSVTEKIEEDNQVDDEIVEKIVSDNEVFSSDDLVEIVETSKNEDNAPEKEDEKSAVGEKDIWNIDSCLLYTSPSPRDLSTSRMPSSA